MRKLCVIVVLGLMMASLTVISTNASAEPKIDLQALMAKRVPVLLGIRTRLVHTLQVHEAHSRGHGKSLCRKGNCHDRGHGRQQGPRGRLPGQNDADAGFLDA